MNTHSDLFLQAMNGELADNSSSVHNQQTLLKGQVCGKGDNEFFVNVGDKSEMILPFNETVGEVNINDQIDVVYNGVKNGVPQVSQKKALVFKAMDDIKLSSENNTPIQAKIVKLVSNSEGAPSGFEVDINGVKAFLPLSHIRAPQNPSDLIGLSYPMVVIKFERNRIVVSEKLIRQKLQNENFEKFTGKFKKGDRIPVKVEEINDSFALVGGEGIRMFLHITEFDWKFIKNLKEVLKIGDTFEVCIQSIDPAKNSVKVSRKDALPNPKEVFLSNKSINDTVSATVIRFGRGVAILESDEGADLILPVQEMSWTKKVSNPQQLLQLGDRVEVQIKDIDSQNQRVIVSLRDLLENPWHNASNTYYYASKHTGHIVSITDFGIFVAFDDGIQGLVRKEDIEWKSEDFNLKEKFTVGMPIVTTVLNCDPVNEKLRVGIKQLSSNPYQNFADNYPIGSVVNTKVVNIFRDGVEVELENGLFAFIHISQLALEKIESPESVCKLGDVVKAVVSRINTERQKIELSIKELLKNQSKQEINRVIENHQVESPNLKSVFGDLLNKMSDQ
ncbi:MAG: S1 RNA-binding domain-containing protein [Brevinemataceae bacterium]